MSTSIFAIQGAVIIYQNTDLGTEWGDNVVTPFIAYAVFAAPPNEAMGMYPPPPMWLN